MKILSDHRNIIDFFDDFPILSCTIRVTDECNLSCMHCYSKSKNKSTSKTMSYNDCISLLNQLKQNNVMRLSITGGEPFCRSDMLNLLVEASKMNFEIYISTNGTIDNIDFDILKKINLKVMQISLDGRRELHDEIRGKKGAYEAALDFIHKIKNANSEIKIGVAFTLMRKNMNELVGLYDELTNLPVDIFSVIPVQKLGRATEEYALNPIQINEKLNLIAQHASNKNNPLKLNAMVSPALVPMQLRKNSEYSNGYLCTFPYSIAIGEDGRCAVCDGLLDFPECILGNLDEGFDKLKDKLKSLNYAKISTSELQGICAKCKLKTFCGGGCRADAYNATNSFCSADVLCQEYFEYGIFPNEFLEDNEQ